MKRIVNRRTEITIETHQTITWRARVTTGTDPEPPQQTPDAVPEGNLDWIAANVPRIGDIDD